MNSTEMRHTTEHELQQKIDDLERFREGNAWAAGELVAPGMVETANRRALEARQLQRDIRQSWLHLLNELSDEQTVSLSAALETITTLHPGSSNISRLILAELEEHGYAKVTNGGMLCAVMR